MTNLIVIPARSGSKGIKDKNIAQVGDKPLFAHTILAAKSVSGADVVVSTDSVKYAEIAESYGAEVPFLRPEALSQDNSSPVDAIFHTLQSLSKNGKHYDHVIQLQPTYYFRERETLERCISRIATCEGALTLITVKEINNTSHPDFVGKINDTGFLVCKSGDLFRRQALSQRYAFFGSVMIAKSKYFMKEKTFFSDKTLPHFIQNKFETLDIDDEHDLMIANLLMGSH
jgi:CMP-N,N'-diacetyllegionaminic acid synthase